MANLTTLQEQLALLHEKYLHLSKGQEDFLRKIIEAEIPESVFNSNAIENSTLTLEETEDIVIYGVVKNLKVREVLEAKNLDQLAKHLMTENFSLSEDNLLMAHKILLNQIDDNLAGRFRRKGENVRVGTHVAPLSGKIPQLLGDLLVRYKGISKFSAVEKLAIFHLDFELIHPFCDGNGRLGRAIMNFQLHQLKLPPVIIRNKEKKKYYSSFVEYKKYKKSKVLVELIAKALLESLHKRLAYLESKKIIPLSEWVRKKKLSPQATLNAAKRQSLPAFRQRGVWMIGD